MERDNASGLRIKSFKQGDTTVCMFRPQAHHTAFPGVLNDRLLMLKIQGSWSPKDLDAQAHDCADKFDPLVPLPAAALRSFPGRG
ncbi:MAG: hypothetical protein U5L00_18165 [Desulfovermiculus sp.]|nr:hypothetical protein [Desulfovermiculus sp.]